MRHVVVLSALLATGCAKLPTLPGAEELAKMLPDVSFKKLNVDDVDLEGAKATFVLQLDNPHPVGLNIPSVNWDLNLAGVDFLQGVEDAPIELAASGASPVKVPVMVRWTDVLALAQGAKGQDAIPFAFSGDVSVNTPLGPVTVPYAHEGELPVLHAPKVSLKALRVEKLDILKQTATLALDLGLESEQGTAIGVQAFDYAISLGGAQVATGATTLAPLQGSTTATLPIDLQLRDLGASVVNAVTQKQSLDVGLVADAHLDTPLGLVPLKIDQVQKLGLK